MEKAYEIISTQEELDWYDLDVITIRHDENNPNDSIATIVSMFQNYHEIILTEDALDYFEDIVEIYYDEYYDTDVEL